MTFFRRLRAAWAVLFPRVTAPRLDAYYARARERLAPWHNGQSISPPAILNVPAVWRSSPDHVVAYLAYISADEAQLLAAIDLHGSGVSEKMHFGPLAIPSYQGDGGGGSDGGDSGGADSGMGGYGDGYGPGDDEDDDDEDDDTIDYGADPDFGFETEASLLSEANYGQEAVDTEYQGITGEAPGPGPSGEAGGTSSAPPEISVATAPEATTQSILGAILTAPPPPEMPMPENSSARLARRRSARAQAQRRGRTSTILSNLDPLGG